MTYSSKEIPSHRWIGLVYLDDLVHLVSFVQPILETDQADRTDQMNKSGWRTFSDPARGRGQRRKRSQRYNALMNTDPTMTGNPNLKNCQNEMG
jgi:hypothetical protein